MKKLSLTLIGLLFLMLTSQAGTPISGLLNRIDTNASRKFVIEYIKSDTDFFELDQQGEKIVIRGNNHVSIATGIHWYLKYYVGIHLTWNNMHAKLPDVLPSVTKKERHETTLKYRYYLNYCTHSYSMAFWDWERWQQEIDWMALHGINLPLTITGTASVWRNVLTRLGYSTDEVNNFVAGPAFQAWWLMNNLEAWGGPNTSNWYEKQEELQKKILERMRAFGMEPVLPGYSGMVPDNAKEKLGLNVAEPGLWCGYRRPAILQPTDRQFQHIADLYYEELTDLYGKANYYSMDPFHEGGSVTGVDLDAAGKAIHTAMKRVNPKAVWVVQAWQQCPYEAMTANLPAGDLIVLDLYSESSPQWGDPSSTWYRENGFGAHDWLYCMLLNYGGNVGLHGKMTHVINEFYKARGSRFGQTLKGVGLTMEGIGNNPVMYELLCELPWRASPFTSNEWLKDYIRARYGKSNPQIEEAWELLRTGIYNCPPSSTQQGTHESIFCARPSLKAYQVSSWSEMTNYYKPEDVIKAAGLMVEAASCFKGNNNFEYDLVDIVRQAVAEKGRLVYSVVKSACLAGEKELFKAAAARFLHLIELQDSLLAARAEFRLGKWIGMARNMGDTEAEKDWLEWNARVQITTWGNRQAADAGGLCDYAHKEWNGLLKDFYYLRWKTYFDYLEAKLNGQEPENIDLYAIEEAWTQKHNSYPQDTEEGCAIRRAQTIYREIFH